MSHPRVVAVAQAFKGTLPVGVVAEALAAGIRAAGATPVILPASDGGDGLLDALAARLGRRTVRRVTDPLGRQVEAAVGWLDEETAVVESRLACGLTLLTPAERDPARTTSRGVGELITAAVDAGARTVHVGLGGSATMDGGMGMARVWGWIPRDGRGEPLPDEGRALERVAEVDPGDRPAARLIALADVTSPLLGPDGARQFAAQKGADPATARRLERGLGRLVEATEGWNGPALARRPGAGAAGGLGFGLLVFAGAELVNGAAWVLDSAGWDRCVERADLVVTGEGAFDGTSGAGKLAGEVLRRARAAGVPAALVAPVVEGGATGVTVETGGGAWDAAELARRTAAAVRRALRLPPP